MKPFDLIRPSGVASPVVVSVPHAGLHVPDELQGELDYDERLLMANADHAVDALYVGVTSTGASLLRANVSRIVVDLNRAPSDIDALSVPEHPSPLADARRGVIWRTAICGRNVLRHPLTLAEHARRIERWHAPYHTQLRALLEETRARHGYVILLDGHSMPGRPIVDGRPGPRHADIVPGCLGGRSCAPALVRAASAHFEGRGYSVAVDDPYRGGFITRRYGQPASGCHALQLEVNRELYLDAITLAPKPRGVSRLRDDLTAFVASLAEVRIPA